MGAPVRHRRRRHLGDEILGELAAASLGRACASGARRAIVVALLLVAGACGRGEAPAGEGNSDARPWLPPALQQQLDDVRQRAGRELIRRDAELDPVHRGLLFDVEPETVRAFMEQIEFREHADGVVLGVSYGPENHGGGILALLLDHWRPEGRSASLSDRYWFEPNQASLLLRRIYEGTKRQLFLPVSGVPVEALDGRLPATAVLPRIAFRYGGPGPLQQRDAYRFIALLARLESDHDAVWTNHFGQRLDLSLLLDHARRVYLARRPLESQRLDHTNLHLPELLLDAGLGPGGPQSIQRRFLEVELARKDFDGELGAEELGHSVENLGRLLSEASLEWSKNDVARVHGALARFADGPLRDLRLIPAHPLAHLALGLRRIEAATSR